MRRTAQCIAQEKLVCRKRLIGTNKCFYASVAYGEYFWRKP
jgi:hypothetical protein